MEFMKRVAGLALLILLPTFALANDLATGMRAFENGDTETAIEIWEQLAADDNVMAQVLLGYIYFEDRVRDPDYVLTHFWWLSAALHGYPEAQNQLGYLFEYGLGVEEDDQEAFRWYSRAANQGHARAQVNVGVLYFEGRGVDQSDAQAMYWFREAAVQGYPDGQLNLGIAYATGTGVTPNIVLAHMWFSIAEANGASNASAARQMAEEEMSRSQIRRARERADVCVATGYADCD